MLPLLFCLSWLGASMCPRDEASCSSCRWPLGNVKGHLTATLTVTMTKQDLLLSLQGNPDSKRQYSVTLERNHCSHSAVCSFLFFKGYKATSSVGEKSLYILCYLLTVILFVKGYICTTARPVLLSIINVWIHLYPTMIGIQVMQVINTKWCIPCAHFTLKY